MYQFHTQEPVPRPLTVQKENLIDFAQNNQSAYFQASPKQRARLDELIGILEQSNFMPRSKTHAELHYAFKKIYGGASAPDSVAELWVKVATMLELKSETPPSGWRWDGLEVAPEIEETHYYGRHPILWKDRALPFGFQDPCYPNDLRDWKRSIPIDNSGGFRDPCLQYGFQRNAISGDLYYACCGLPLTHPGCWRGPVKNKIVPYQAFDPNDWEKKMPSGTRYIVHESDNERYDRIIKQVEDLKKLIDPAQEETVEAVLIVNRILALEKEYNRWSCAGKERRLVRVEEEEEEILSPPLPSPPPKMVDVSPASSENEEEETPLPPVEVVPSPPIIPKEEDEYGDFIPPAPRTDEIDVTEFFDLDDDEEEEEITLPPVNFDFNQLKQQLSSNKTQYEVLLDILKRPNKLLKLFMDERPELIDEFKRKVNTFSTSLDSATQETILNVVNADTELQTYQKLIETIYQMQNFGLLKEELVDGIDNELYKDVELFKELKEEFQLVKMIEFWNLTPNYPISQEYPNKVKADIDAFKLMIDEMQNQYLLNIDKRYIVESGDSDELKQEKIRFQDESVRNLIAENGLVPDDTNLQILLAIEKSSASEMERFLPPEFKGQMDPTLTPFKIAYLQKKVRNEDLKLATQNLINALEALKYALWKDNVSSEEEKLAFEISPDDQESVKQAKRDIQKQIADKLIPDELNAQILLAIYRYKSSGDISKLDKWIGNKALRYPSDTLNNLKLQYVIDQLDSQIPTNAKKRLENAITELLKKEYETIERKYAVAKKDSNVRYYLEEIEKIDIPDTFNFFFYNTFADAFIKLNILKAVKFPTRADRVLVEKTIRFKKPKQNAPNGELGLTAFKWDKNSCWAEASFNVLFCYPGNDLDEFLWGSNKVYVPERLKLTFEDGTEKEIDGPTKCGQEEDIFRELLNDIRYLQDPSVEQNRKLCKTATFFTGDNCFLEPGIKYGELAETGTFVNNIRDFFKLPIGIEGDETSPVLYTGFEVSNTNYILTGVVLYRQSEHYTCLIRDFDDKWWYIDNKSKHRAIHPDIQTEADIEKSLTVIQNLDRFPSKDTEGNILPDEIRLKDDYKYELFKRVYILRSTWQIISEKNKKGGIQLTNAPVIGFSELNPESQSIVRGFNLENPPNEFPTWFNRINESKQLQESARFYLEFGQN